MNIPFTIDQFLGVFAEYNTAVWPAQLVLNALGLAAVYSALRATPGAGRLATGMLSLLWIWCGVVYDLLYFSSINNAAYVFAALFVLQGIILFVKGTIKGEITFRFQSDIYGIAGGVLVSYGLIIYPLLGRYLGHVYPSAPTFGLPCPTTIVTCGVMLWTVGRVSKTVLVIPFLWSLIGSNAALSFGIYEDFGLFTAGIVMLGLIYYRDKRAGVLQENARQSA
jgi:hypothetical protein